MHVCVVSLLSLLLLLLLLIVTLTRIIIKSSVVIGQAPVTLNEAEE